MAEVSPSPLVGTVLGDVYRLTREIGRGGMGAVYEGVHLRLNRRVAVKLMARELAMNSEALARFRREAEVTSQLGHPHIVQVFDFGQAPTGEPYLVMEYLEGEDLDARMRRDGRQPASAAVHIIKQIASALAATHAKGIVHRDLKPANVFVLTVEGETDFVKVVDFGISKVKSAATRLTAAETVIGTPNYMSPEQAAGRIDEIDSATDQWALACIAYELLAGRPPFVGDSVASLLYQVVHQAPAPLAARVPGLPAGIEEVLSRGLAKQPAERFASVTAFARAFESAASGAGVSSGALAPAPVADGALAVAATGLAVAPPPTHPSQHKAVETTFSTAASEKVSAGAAVPAPRDRRLLAIGIGAIAVAAVAAGAVALSHRPGSPSAASNAGAAAGGAPAAAAATSGPSVPAPAEAPPRPPPAPTAIQPAAAVAPAAAAVAPEEKSAATTSPHPRHKKTKAGASAEAAAPTPAPGAAPVRAAAADAPAWPPPPKSPPADTPAWPPPPKAAPVTAHPAATPAPRADSADAPAWPPPPDNGAGGAGAAPPPKRRRLMQRIFGN